MQMIDLKPKPRLNLLILTILLLSYLVVGTWWQPEWRWEGILLSQIGILFLPAWLLRKTLNLKLDNTRVQQAPKFGTIFGVFLLTFVFIFLIEGLTQLQSRWWPLPTYLEKFYTELTTIQSGWKGLVQFFSLVLIPAVCEEMFFRGWLQTSFEQCFQHSFKFISNKGLTQVLAMSLTALLFALVHFNPWYLLQYFLLGLYLSWLKTWKGQISLCIGAHFLNNLMSVYGTW